MSVALPGASAAPRAALMRGAPWHWPTMAASWPQGSPSESLHLGPSGGGHVPGREPEEEIAAENKAQYKG
ncbi:hypothetical protein Stube_42720 [Streptomyces tubercidicus]|uniref:Uncharacterized protein n=1 Tax=Streptomyces tubercidicus TaxID=47759 RepID=A0A640UUW1_9ACTN|nr:hypothetical protein Stube_42720 [Streptomyces tubercidicus]